MGVQWTIHLYLDSSEDKALPACLPYSEQLQISVTLIDAEDKGRGPIVVSVDCVPGAIVSDSE